MAASPTDMYGRMPSAALPVPGQVDVAVDQAGVTNLPVRSITS